MEKQGKLTTDCTVAEGRRQTALASLSELVTPGLFSKTLNDPIYLLSVSAIVQLNPERA